MIEGARFYRPAFYLAAENDDQGHCRARMVTLPDTSQTYIANVTAWPFISSNFQLTLTDGWNLTGINGTSDSTAILTALAGLKSGGEGPTLKPTLLAT